MGKPEVGFFCKTTCQISHDRAIGSLARSAYRSGSVVGIVGQPDTERVELLYRLNPDSIVHRGPYEPKPPASWRSYVRQWLQRHQIPGEFALVAHGPAEEAGHRMEVIEL